MSKKMDLDEVFNSYGNPDNYGGEIFGEIFARVGSFLLLIYFCMYLIYFVMFAHQNYQKTDRKKIDALTKYIKEDKFNKISRYGYPIAVNKFIRTKTKKLFNKKETKTYFLDKKSSSGETLLISAIKSPVKSQEKIIKKLLDFGVSVDALSPKEKSPLTVALSSKTSPNIVKILLSNGAKISNKKKTSTPLLIAINKNLSVDVVKILLKEKDILSDLLNKDEFYYNLAIENNRADLIDLFIDYDLDLKKVGGNSILVAIKKNFPIKTIEKMLKNGIPVNVFDKHLDTPLLFAIENNNIDLFNLLLKYNADVNFRHPKSRITNLIIAIDAKNPNINIINRLLEKGVKFESVNHITPMAVAIKNKNIEIVKLLINKKYDKLETLLISMISKEYKEIFEYVLTNLNEKKYPEIAEFLIKNNQAGENFNLLLDKLKSNDILNNLLIVSAENNNQKAINHLLSYNVNIYTRKDGKNIFDIFKDKRVSLPRQLLSKKKEVDNFFKNIKNKNEEKVLDMLKNKRLAFNTDVNGLNALSVALLNEASFNLIDTLVKLDIPFESTIAEEALNSNVERNPDTNVLDYLLEMNNNLKKTSDETIDNLLFKSIKNKNENIFFKLYSIKSDIDDVKNDNNENLLFVAIKEKNIPIANFLLDKNLSSLEINKQGENCLFWSVKNSFSTDFIVKLIEKGGDTKYKTQNNENLLMVAVQQNADVELVNILLEDGISIDDKNSQGKTVFNFIKSKTKKEIKDLLQNLKKK